MKKILNEGNRIHNFISSSGSGTVISYGSGSDFLTSYGSGSTTLDFTRQHTDFYFATLKHALFLKKLLPKSERPTVISLDTRC
jgi:hypothetical protein